MKNRTRQLRGISPGISSGLAFVSWDAGEDPYQIAEAYAFRRDNDHAFEWLERTYRQRDSGLSWLRPDPLLGDLRKDPRWDPLLRKLGLADDQLK